MLLENAGAGFDDDDGDRCSVVDTAAGGDAARMLADAEEADTEDALVVAANAVAARRNPPLSLSRLCTDSLRMLLAGIPGAVIVGPELAEASCASCLCGLAAGDVASNDDRLGRLKHSPRHAAKVCANSRRVKNLSARPDAILSRSLSLQCSFHCTSALLACLAEFLRIARTCTRFSVARLAAYERQCRNIRLCTAF